MDGRERRPLVDAENTLAGMPDMQCGTSATHMSMSAALNMVVELPVSVRVECR